MTLAILLLFSLLGQQQECIYDNAACPDMCKVWEHSRFVCEPKQYPVVVYNRSDIDKVDILEGAILECPVSNGEPDRAHCKLSGGE
jgi:hypothetical protein